MHNDNEATKDAFGRTERSSHQENMRPGNTLGKFIIRDIATGVELKCGTGEGMTHALRQQIWNEREKYVGRIITYKFQPHGTKDAPRFPIFRGFRSLDDMGDN